MGARLAPQAEGVYVPAQEDRLQEPGCLFRPSLTPPAKTALDSRTKVTSQKGRKHRSITEGRHGEQARTCSEGKGRSVKDRKAGGRKELDRTRGQKWH